MDVTSLLNSSMAPAEQPKQVEASTPSRSRTPWDAGGYSLPINTVNGCQSTNTFRVSNAALSSPIQRIHCDDSVQSRVIDSNAALSEAIFAPEKHTRYGIDMASQRMTTITTSSGPAHLPIHHDNFLPNPDSTTTTSSGSAHLPIHQDTYLSDPDNTAANLDLNFAEVSRHKFSDSRSSLSSFSSSLQSTQHSRTSTNTTINSFPIGNLSPKARNSIQPLDFAAMDINIEAGFGEHVPPSASSTGSLDALALVAEQHLSADRVESAKQSSSTPPFPASIKIMSSRPPEEDLPRGRPSSPSDAVLIKRSTVPILRVNTGDTGLQTQYQNQLHTNPNAVYLSAPLENHHQSVLSRTHKRCVSAPDLPPMKEHPTRESHGPRAEPTPPSSYHPDNASPVNNLTFPTPETPPNTTHTDQEVICMYITDCDTGSQLRKAISHIFGRNKMCTRLIPSSVWVHYCRKHYQRSRYRNPKEFAKLQCDLVQLQIRRVHEWGLENAKNGRPGVVKDWGLAVRKREQKRLDELAGASRKRKAGLYVLEDEEEHEDDGDTPGLHGNAIPATAVPDWLVAFCGKKYSTQAVLAIFNQLHQEILDDKLPCFPDIEILPNIVADQDEQPYKRPSTNSHRRSQSLGVGPNQNTQTINRRSSQPSIHGNEAPESGHPEQKRRRMDELSTIRQESFLSQFSRPRVVERSGDTSRRTHQLAHRPTFPNIDEHQDNEYSYDQTLPRDFHEHSSIPHHSLLAAPTPQRSTMYSTAENLEHSEGYSSRRSIHSRSQSFDSRNSYLQTRGQYLEESSRLQSPNSSTRIQQMHGPGHARHQSTPMAQQSYSASLFESQARETHVQTHSNHRYSQNHNTLPPPLHLLETEETRAIYCARR